MMHKKKLESFRKKNKKYLYPSFNTIAGAGKNGAIVHYRATKKTAKKINKSDILFYVTQVANIVMELLM